MNKTCEMTTGWDSVTMVWTTCGNTATVEKWDCCEGTQVYCSECVWDGGTTEYCEWSNQAL